MDRACQMESPHPGPGNGFKPLSQPQDRVPEGIWSGPRIADNQSVQGLAGARSAGRGYR